MPTMTIEIPERSLRLAKERAAKRGLSLPEFFSDAIELEAETRPESYRRLEMSRLNARTLQAMADAEEGRTTPITLDEIRSIIHGAAEESD